MTTINQINSSINSVTGSGAFCGSSSASISSPTLVTPALGTPSAGVISSCTGFNWGVQTSGSPIELQMTSGTVQSSDMIVLNGTPFQAIAAQGSNTVIQVNYFAAYYIYNGTPYTAGSVQSIRLLYGTGTTPSVISTLFTNAVLTGSADAFSCGPSIQVGNPADTAVVNVGIFFKNPIAVEISAGDGTINYWIWYTVINLTDL